ncbi:LysR family transcriptional regulator [Mangrovicoccus sp. HB161399]|uniref:LysR family transcriptional regulator n=1 Tax=Mangrovicoccus sp. HB161399 TaxID=2720392 RepID=UPI001557A2CF|nr:LysR family transcriptional regulator [Mangrovicoccus sp. HB161399]
MRARQLEVFCMIMRCGTVTGAAAMLNISQPALSQVLLHAEDELGFKLFNRVKGRLVPTQEAEELYPEAERIFSELGALRRRTVDMRHGRTGLVRLAASTPPSLSIVPHAMAAFRDEHPEIIVRSLIAPYLNMVDMLRNNDATLAVAMNNQPVHDLEVETVGHAEMVCLMPQDHPLAAKPEIRFPDLTEETLISYRVNTLPGRALAGVAGAEGMSYAPAIEIDVSMTAYPFVRQRLGIAILDGLVPWEDFPGVAVRPFRPVTRMPIAILTNADRPLSAAHKMMRDHLRAACRRLEETQNR